MLKGVLRLSQESDIQLLCYLWKWKLATTSAIATAIYRGRNTLSVYRRLYTLQKGGMIQSLASRDGLSFVWTLDRNGFSLIEELLPQLESHGYRSEHIGHDFLVTAIHQGEWVTGIPAGYDVFTEQELRRFKFENYPSWVPKTTTHRPDGWWLIQDGSDTKKFALEVELSVKSPSEYARLGLFYDEKIQTDGVIWLVRDNSEAAYVRRHLLSGLAAPKDLHSFILRNVFLEYQWQAPFALGHHKGQSLQSILKSSGGTKVDPLMTSGNSMVLLDTRKKPINPISPLQIQKSNFLW